MKNLTKTVSNLFAILLISLVFIQCKDAKDAAVTKYMEIQAELVNKQCPLDMGGIVLKSCNVESGRTFKYIFSIPTDSEEFDAVAGKAASLESIKSSSEFNQVKDYQLTYAYEYRNASDKVIGEIKITPEDYND